MVYDSTNLVKGTDIFYKDCDKSSFEPLVQSCFASDLDGVLDRGGFPRQWIMDCRKGLADSANLQLAADWFVSVLDKLEIDQVVVKGYGAYLLIGSILITSYKPLTAGIIRESAKGYDKDIIIEGNLNPKKKVLLVDDILNSGSSAIDAVKTLSNHNFKEISAAFLMKFSIGKNGEVELNKRGIHTINYAMEVKNK